MFNDVRLFSGNHCFQIEAIVQDTTAQGCISDIDALNIRLENQVEVSASAYILTNMNCCAAIVKRRVCHAFS